MLQFLSAAQFDALDLTSVTGIIAATFAIVEILKRLIQNQNSFLGRTPVWIYSVIVSAVLAFLANKVIRRDATHYFLEGDLWVVMWKSVLGAASASGFFTWFRNPSGSMASAQPLGTPVNGEDHTMKPSILLVPFMLGALLFTGGCATPSLTSNPTPKTQVAQMAEAYSGVVQSLVELRKEGLIQAGSPLDTTIKEADNRAYSFLRSARSSAEVGTPVSQALIDGFNAAIADMQTGKADAEHFPTASPVDQKGQFGIEAIAALAFLAVQTWQKMQAEGRATTTADEEAALKQAFADADAAHEAEQNDA